ncbi:gp037L [Rabbit fibroma virus]|uniref:Gp037L n=1 Tax=Rabbit fibroma virus (strain Kasza) TaxID=10272 RepID=Q9Q934_RFVKA|nr:gp037L [Rabbit fibroma virus]AAF17919.1 gp037L [Rabbit fibroma virus]
MIIFVIFIIAFVFCGWISYGFLKPYMFLNGKH